MSNNEHNASADKQSTADHSSGEFSASSKDGTPGYFGQYGGMFVPEILIPALEQLEQAFNEAVDDASFVNEFNALLKNFAGRPTPLYECRNLTNDKQGRIFLKREDLLHGGAHKTNQVLGQVLLAKRMGKKRIIAETGAGQHGVATAIACALMDLPCVVYMGAVDCARQQPNVYRMELMDATVIPVDNGSGTLKDAINEALRDWAASYDDTHYLLGTAAGAHPFPTIVREFHKMIGEDDTAIGKDVLELSRSAGSKKVLLVVPAKLLNDFQQLCAEDSYNLVEGIREAMRRMIWDRRGEGYESPKDQTLLSSGEVLQLPRQQKFYPSQQHQLQSYPCIFLII